MIKIIEKLTILANKLDTKGLSAEANGIDEVIHKISSSGWLMGGRTSEKENEAQKLRDGRIKLRIKSLSREELEELLQTNSSLRNAAIRFIKEDQSVAATWYSANMENMDIILGLKELGLTE